MLNRIIKTIEQYDSIVLFRHEYPDMDAIGSQLGLKEIIQDAYPEKNVYALGGMSDVARHFTKKMDEATDEQIAASLAIITDTSNASRVDDQRYKLAKASIRIDHHIKTETFCDMEVVDEKATAACEIIALALRHANIRISKKAAQLLYSGLVADNIRFTITTVRPQTFLAASYLMEMGVDVLKCEQDNFASTYADYQYETKVRNKVRRIGNCLYAIMEPEDYLPLTFSQAKEKVYVLSGVQGIQVWALFTRMGDGIHYSASLRSKTYMVRDIAAQFGGGGHVCASGIKNLTKEQVLEIIQLLEKRSMQQS